MIDKRLNEYVLEKEEEARMIGLLRSPFGLSTTGNRMDGWQSLGQRYELFTRYQGYADFAPSNYIEIVVPATSSGARAHDEDRQPYYWDGSINEYVAEMAVWWAFNIITETEALQFLNSHKPVVLFFYMERRRRKETAVQYENGLWVVRQPRLQ
ncbi:MAG TPA: hypothetical protein VLM75_15890 [Spirochaetota bacterium]|nr:hypothetical protein [Spirochaetota bacterium]